MIAQQQHDPLIRTGRAGLTGHPSFVVGLDLGKIRDYSAVAVLECRDWVSFDRDPVSQEFLREREVTLRYVKRVPLQTPYPDVVTAAQKVAAYCGQLGSTTLVVDATGGGEPVVDLARWRGAGPSSSRMKFSMIPVTITSGDSQSANSSGDGYRVPKRDLVVGLQTAIRRRWLRICKGSPDASALIEELAAMRMVERDDGRAGFGARRGMHDDLVMATALAWWRVRRAGLAPPIGR